MQLGRGEKSNRQPVSDESHRRGAYQQDKLLTAPRRGGRGEA